MAYFPAFIKLDNMKILIVGGGYIASEKLEKLLDFTNDITIIAPKLSTDMKNMIDRYDLSYKNRLYQVGDIAGFGVVIVAVDDIDIQKSIYEESRKKRILCNAVDSVKYCDFIFPSYIKKGDLTIAVSTSGASPAVAKHLRRYLEKIIPDSIVEFLAELKDYRASMSKGKERMEFLDQKAKEYFQNISKD